MTLVVTATDSGLLQAAPPGASRQAPLMWDEDWTFRMGSTQIATFEREGDSGPATLLRLDGGGSHYVLRRQP